MNKEWLKAFQEDSTPDDYSSILNFSGNAMLDLLCVSAQNIDCFNFWRIQISKHQQS